MNYNLLIGNIKKMNITSQPSNSSRVDRSSSMSLSQKSAKCENYDISTPIDIETALKGIG